MIFGAPSLHPKIPFPAAGALNAKLDRTAHCNSDFWVTVIEILDRRGSYSGLSPSASNCRLHSVGGSRSRSMPMPRGRRPCTAALTSLGARKASEMVMLTCRTLHFSRALADFTMVGRCPQGNIWGNSVSANVYSVGRYSGYISKFADSIALVIRN